MNSAEYKKGKRNLFEFMFGIILFTLIFAAASFLVGITLKNYINGIMEKKNSEPTLAGAALPTVIIDPGHGGEDGGCSSGEVLEKDLNLQVSDNIYSLCGLMGLPAKTTRNEDKLLYDMYGDLTDYKGKKKTFDLKNRVRFAKEEEGGIYLGIHMNKFPQSIYKGLQVYYSSGNSSSKALADKIQSYTREYLQKDNDRQTKNAADSIYVLSKLDIPAVLVECGFLSNDEELSNLTSAEYRKKLSLEIFASCAEFAYSQK